MKIDRVGLMGFITAVSAALFFFILLVSYEFPAFNYASPSTELVEVTTKFIGREVGRFLWTHRLPDLIAQAFVLFAASVCCVAILRAEEEKK